MNKKILMGQRGRKISASRGLLMVNVTPLLSVYQYSFSSSILGIRLNVTEACCNPQMYHMSLSQMWELFIGGAWSILILMVISHCICIILFVLIGYLSSGSEVSCDTPTPFNQMLWMRKCQLKAHLVLTKVFVAQRKDILKTQGLLAGTLLI